MSFQLFWYMLAAFIVGFALSTLWEWFYFRGRRLQWRDERVNQLEAELDANQAALDRYRAQERGVATAATYATAPTSAVVTEYQSSAARLESEQRDLAGTAMHFARRDTRQRPPNDEREQTPPSADRPPPFEPEEQAPSAERPARTISTAQRFVAPAEFVSSDAGMEERGQTVAKPAQNAERAPSAERPDRIVTATPQAHAELAELIARMDELERKTAAKTEDMDNVEYSVDIERIAARAGRSTVQPTSTEESTTAETSTSESAGPMQVAEAASSPSPAQSDPVVTPAPQPIAASPSRLDDLQEISGIGKTYAKRLREGGIHTWRQVAESDEETLRTLAKARAVTDVADWIAQAAELMRRHGQPGANNQTA